MVEACMQSLRGAVSATKQSLARGSKIASLDACRCAALRTGPLSMNSQCRDCFAGGSSMGRVVGRPARNDREGVPCCATWVGAHGSPAMTVEGVPCSGHAAAQHGELAMRVDGQSHYQEREG